MLFAGNMVRSYHLVISSYIVPFLSISGHYDVIWKKFEKLLISRFLVTEIFFRNKYNLMVISIVYASKWWVTWPFHTINSKMAILTALLQIYSNFRSDDQKLKLWMQIYHLKNNGYHTSFTFRNKLKTSIWAIFCI